jgi:ATP-dependent Zn protease
MERHKTMNKLAQIEKTAYHEAGHAVAAYALRRRFGKITIVPMSDKLSAMTTPESNWIDFNLVYDLKPKARNRIEADIIIYFAGAVAERVFAGQLNWKGSGWDNLRVKGYVESIVSSEDELETYLGWLRIRARNLIQSPLYWAAVQTLASELLKHKTIGYRRARRIIADAMEEELHRL